MPAVFAGSTRPGSASKNSWTLIAWNASSLIEQSVGRSLPYGAAAGSAGGGRHADVAGQVELAQHHRHTERPDDADADEHERDRAGDAADEDEDDDQRRQRGLRDQEGPAQPDIRARWAPD